MQKFEIFRTGLLKFLEAGYLYIGMDHFARPNDELATAQANRTLHRNFQGYSTKAGADLYGMGVTAISGFGNAYAQNFRELPAWEKAVHERGIATMRGYHLSQEDRLRREVISRLLCHTVIPKREINEAFGIDFDAHFAEELLRFELPREDGLLTIDQDEIRTTWLGRIFIRNLAMLFDPYLEKQHLDAKPLFSKTL
jgi:oxygen-independent coproporphyrinogen-3 oxidase